MKLCEEHVIVWDYKNMSIDGEVLHVYGSCDRCGRSFQETWGNPKYSVMEDQGLEWQDYELLGTEIFT